ncbi:hypothetical protein [Cyclobacterium amurskyense]|uniref:hypothetical protein n=1 Tax=Cyclobacterium amurskyense TaxID=320787 RepID=UPI0030DCFAF5|tara:strand:- start:3331 stop:4983 length:1653 start_codon:yes stop_codon:yes gene_type:complete
MNRQLNTKYLTLTMIILGLCFLGNYSLLAQNNQQLPEEEVIAYVVNPVSLTEEYLWMNVSVTADDQPSPSKVIYMELLDRNGISVVRDLADLVDGEANSYLNIPSDLPSDHYLLRVYTRISPYVSGEKGVFQSIVSIINPKKPPVILPSKEVVNSNSVKQLDENLIEVNDNLIEVSIPLEKANDISLVINKSTPFDNLESNLNFSEMYSSVASTTNTTLVPELYGHIIKGKLLDEKIDTTELFFLTLHGSQSHMFVDKPDSKGNLYFDTGNFSYYDYAIIQSTRTDQQVNFILATPFWEKIPEDNFQLPVLKLSREDKTFIEEKILARASHQYYLAPLKIPEKPLPFQYITDYSYFLDDYNRFEDMATTIREYVPMVLVRNQNRKTIFKNFNIPYNLVFKENPLLVIDGMPVLDSDAFANFNPKGIARMDIINRYFYINDQQFTGMVNLTSFKNDFGGFDLPKNALFITYSGVQKPYQYFPNTELTINNDHFPDFRSTLTWQTNLKADENGNLNFTFKPSRLKGRYMLRIQYMDKLNKSLKTNKYYLDID